MLKLTWMNRLVVALVVVNLALLPLSMQSSSQGIVGPTYAAAQDPCDPPDPEGDCDWEPGDEEPHYSTCCLPSLDGEYWYCCVTCCPHKVEDDCTGDQDCPGN